MSLPPHGGMRAQFTDFDFELLRGKPMGGLELALERNESERRKPYGLAGRAQPLDNLACERVVEMRALGAHDLPDNHRVHVGLVGDVVVEIAPGRGLPEIQHRAQREARVVRNSHRHRLS